MSTTIADLVKETTTTTGTGAITLAGAVAGFRSFSSVCAVGDKVGYVVRGVSSSGAFTSEWETGVGTYSALNTLTRTSVKASSNSNAAVSFSSGTKQVSLTVIASQTAFPGYFSVSSYTGTLDQRIAAALADIYANNGGELFFPFDSAGYSPGASIVIDPGQYNGGAGINVNLNGNTFTPSHTGWCFDFKTNYFGANNGAILGKKPVRLLGNGATIYTSNTAASGGVRWQDTVAWRMDDLTIKGYSSGTALQLYITSNDHSTWVEHGEVSNVRGSGNLNGLYLKSSNSTASFLGNSFRNLAFEGTVNNSILYNLEGLLFNCTFSQVGGYYNQGGATGGMGFYLNGGYCGTTFTTPWIDAGGAGTQSVATDIVFGPNYEGITAQYQPIFLGVTEIDLPINWRANIQVVGPTNITGALSGLASANPREVMVTNRTYYVSTTGSDTANTGLSSSSPFATVANALSVIYGTLDCAGFNVTIKLADGTYTAPITISGNPMGIGSGTFTIEGNATTPGNVVLSCSADCFVAKNDASVSVKGLKFQTTSGTGLKTDSGARIFVLDGCQFGSCTAQHIFATVKSMVQVLANYTITGNAPIHWNAALDSTILSFGNTIDASNRAFSNIFATATETSIIAVSGTFTTTGSTGTRYYITSGATIQTYGAGANYLPGNAAGYADTATYGQYL
jgi:hypothetical protein